MPKNFFHIEFRRTKKRRVCSECSKVILKGDKYAWTVGRSMGNFQYAAICESCGRCLKEQQETSPPKPNTGLVF